MKYVGSKNRISKQIAPIIQSYIDGMGDKCNGYWEPFVGGANMIDKIKCEYKYGTDKHKYLIALLRHVQQTVDDLPNTITEDEYKAVNTNPNNYPNWYVGLVGFCTFGAKWFGGYPRGFKADGVTPRDITNEAIRNIKKQAPNLKGIEFYCSNYLDQKEMSKTNIVLVSEYWMPEDGFECIWSGELKCTLDKNSRSNKVEKLYLCKG